MDAIRDAAGYTPHIGGIEYADDIVQNMDLERMQHTDESLNKVITELRQRFRSWSAGVL